LSGLEGGDALHGCGVEGLVTVDLRLELFNAITNLPPGGGSACPVAGLALVAAPLRSFILGHAGPRGLVPEIVLVGGL